MVRTEGQNILKFLHVQDFLKNAISKCKLRLFEPLKLPHLKMKNIFWIRINKKYLGNRSNLNNKKYLGETTGYKL